jgi:transcription elongation factor Elf1
MSPRKSREQFQFADIRTSYDGGSYATFECPLCETIFYVGTGKKVKLPDGTEILRCPTCGCVDKSWKPEFIKQGLLVPEAGR